MITQQDSKKKNLPIYFALVVSAILSIWMGWQSGVVNPDAICYLLSAETVGNAGLYDAMKLCPQAQWPFYPMLIFLVANVTHLSFVVSAYFLNTIFSLLSVLFFMLIVRQLGGSQRTLWFAAFVILSAHHFIGVREYIIRDHGFWAAYLATIYFLQLYFEKQRIRDILFFTLSAVLAALFRIEGVLFLVLSPFIVWFLSGYHFTQRLRMFLMLYAPLFLLSIVLGIVWLFHSHSDIGHVSRLNNLYLQLAQAKELVAYRLQTGKDLLTHYVLPLEAQSSAGTIWILTLISWYMVELVNNLTPIYAILLIYAWFYRLPVASNEIERNRFIVLVGFIAINLFITAGYFAEYFFLSKRYLMALSLVFMLWVPFALEDLFANWKQKRSRYLYIAASCIIVVYALTALVNIRDSKNYIREGGIWLANNVPSDKKIYTNDLQLMYYSNHFGAAIYNNPIPSFSWSSHTPDNFKQYDYVALRINHKEQAVAKPVLDQLTTQPVQVFHNVRGDEVVIYQMHF